MNHSPVAREREMRDFDRAEIEALTTDELLIVLPENWQLWKDSGWWRLTDDQEIEFWNNAGQEPSPRLLLIEFLLNYQESGNDLFGMNDVHILQLARWKAQGITGAVALHSD